MSVFGLFKRRKRDSQWSCSGRCYVVVDDQIITEHSFSNVYDVVAEVERALKEMKRYNYIVHYPSVFRIVVVPNP